MKAGLVKDCRHVFEFHCGSLEMCVFMLIFLLFLVIRLRDNVFIVMGHLRRRTPAPKGPT